MGLYQAECQRLIVEGWKSLSMQDQETTEDKQVNRSWIWVVFLLLVVVILLVLAAVLPAGEPFDSNTWKRAQAGQDEVSIETRFQMAESLVASGLLIGMARSEVIALVGNDPGSGYFKGSLAYELGPQRNSYFAIDSDWLVIQFDGDDRVVEVRIRSD